MFRSNGPPISERSPPAHSSTPAYALECVRGKTQVRPWENSSPPVGVLECVRHKTRVRRRKTRIHSVCTHNSPESTNNRRREIPPRLITAFSAPVPGAAARRPPVARNAQIIKNERRQFAGTEEISTFASRLLSGGVKTANPQVNSCVRIWPGRNG